MKEYTEQALNKMGYHVVATVDPDTSVGLPSPSQMRDAFADSAFRAKKGQWHLCKNRLSVKPKAPRLRSRSR